MVIPNYTLRYSKKAKYLQLRLSQSGLEVVIPSKRSFSSHVIEEFIQKKQAWITRNWRACTDTESQASCHDSDTMLPGFINLEAVTQRWEISYVSTRTKKLMLVANHCRQLTLMGNISNTALCLQLLKKWLKKVAQEILTKQLHLASAETGFSFQDVSVRSNVTRWGSCSSQKNISLCCNLMFLPYDLMRHVLLHELCHTKVMNHGPSFWKLLEGFDPQAKANAKQLKLAARNLPNWLK